MLMQFKLFPVIVMQSCTVMAAHNNSEARDEIW